MMGMKTLYLAWQNDQSENGHGDSPSWFPIGRLDVDIGECARHRFRYTRGAKEAKLKAGFVPLPEFPDFEGDYESPALFPVFQNRVISRNRPDFAEYVRVLALDEDADQIEILSANGGKRATDSFAVFPNQILERMVASPVVFSSPEASTLTSPLGLSSTSCALEKSSQFHWGAG